MVTARDRRVPVGGPGDQASSQSGTVRNASAGEPVLLGGEAVTVGHGVALL